MGQIRDPAIVRKLKSNRTLVIVLLIGGIAAWLGPVWLSLGILAFYVLYRLLLFFCNHIRNPMFRSMTRLLLILFFVFLISTTMNMFVAELYAVPSRSMENSLLPGDVILVNKLAYGPRLPRSPYEISWFNFLFAHKTSHADTLKHAPHLRASGTSQINRGEIFVFAVPKVGFVVKRCVAVAGDSFMIRNGEIYINAHQYISPAGVKNTYKIYAENKSDYQALLNKLYHEFKSGGILESFDFVTVNLTGAEADQLRSLQGVQVSFFSDSASKSVNLFTEPDLAGWTLDHMGPLLVPKKGATIPLTTDNFAIYSKTIRMHEGKDIQLIDNSYYLNGLPCNAYTFEHNYYFVMGDNRKESFDSRYQGFIPEETIIGKAGCILYSTYQRKFSWNRLFKKIE